MPLITLKAGDFGAGQTVTVGEEEMYLPDPAAPGTFVTVPLSDIAEVETVSADHSNQVKDAVRLGITGAALLGPVGLAAGVFAMRKVKDVTFLVRLKDGRQFVAMSSAKIYADLRGARLGGGLSGAAIPDEHPADDVIAKYLKEHGGPVAAPEPVAAAPASAGKPSETRPEAPTRPTFGRRRS